MAHPPYLREKARSMRREKGLTIDELATRLALSRTTIYYWVRDIPIERTTKQTAGQRAATRAMQRRCLKDREIAYNNGFCNFTGLARDPQFRDFVCLYIAEGYKRSRHHVSLANSDPVVIELAYRWIAAFSRNRVTFQIQYHADQDLPMLLAFWADRLRVRPDRITHQRKSNSGQLSGRIWRSRFGVLTVRANDVCLRAMLQGWMDRLQNQWLDSAVAGA